MTYNQDFELQVYKCIASAGTFTLSFRQDITLDIAFSATAAEVKAALEFLTTIREVAVVFSSGSAVCTSDGSNVMSVEFLQELGDVPYLIEDVSGLTQVCPHPYLCCAVFCCGVM
jgi:GTP cyclohydrolase III